MGSFGTILLIKSFWEALTIYPGNFTIQFENIPRQRTHDCPLMEVAHSAGLQGQELASFNRCRCERKLLFLSDVSTSSGDRIEPWVLQEKSSFTSTLVFPTEHPTEHDRRLWHQFWNSRPHNTPPLGDWITTPHFQWPWHIDAESGFLYEVAQDGWMVYERLSQRTRLGSGYVPTHTTNTLPPSYPASITQTYCAGRSIILNPIPGPPLTTLTPPMSTVWDLLHSWGGEWMWASIFFPGNCTDITWLISGIEAGTVIGCADG